MLKSIDLGQSFFCKNVVSEIPPNVQNHHHQNCRDKQEHHVLVGESQTADLNLFLSKEFSAIKFDSESEAHFLSNPEAFYQFEDNCEIFQFLYGVHLKLDH